MLMSHSIRNISTKQNFRRISPTLVWTPRLRSIWIYRNVFILIFLRQQLTLKNATYWNWSKSSALRDFITNFILIKKLHFLLTNIYLKSYTIRISNLSKSCDYWSINNGINYLDNQHSNLKITMQTNANWYRLYVKPKALVGLFVSKKLYKIELIKFIQLIIYNWRALNHQRLYISGYPIVTHEWFLLRFLGTQYFKLLNF